MHRSVGNHNKTAREDGKANNVFPQRTIVKAESAQYRGAWNFDVEAVLMIDQGEIFHFVDNETFKAVMEDGELRYISFRFADK